MSVLAVAGTPTSTIDLGVGVVPTYPRYPPAPAQHAATAQVVCGGRLTLGVGVSHRPVIEGLHGLAYTAPAAHMREYLSVLVPLLRTAASPMRASTPARRAAGRYHVAPPADGRAPGPRPMRPMNAGAAGRYRGRTTTHWGAP